VELARRSFRPERSANATKPSGEESRVVAAAHSAAAECAGKSPPPASERRRATGAYGPQGSSFKPFRGAPAFDRLWVKSGSRPAVLDLAGQLSNLSEALQVC